jgi:hypothetical protein
MEKTHQPPLDIGSHRNAGAQLLPEAGARHERTLEAVGCSAWFGDLPPTCMLGLTGPLAMWERMALIVSGPPPCPTGGEP